MSHLFHRIGRRYGWDGTFHPQKLRRATATWAALGRDRTALEIKMGWAPNSPVAKRYIEWSQELDAAAETQAAISPLRAMARLRRRN